MSSGQISRDGTVRLPSHFLGLEVSNLIFPPLVVVRGMKKRCEREGLEQNGDD